MTNSRASKGYKLLHTYKSPSTGTTETYTPVTALDMKTQYSEIKIIFNGKTTATLVLQMKINGITDYNLIYIKADSATLTTALVDADGVHSLAPSAILDGAVSFFGEISITCPISEMGIRSIFTSPHEGSYEAFSITTATITTITSIQLLVSTSTWIAGTEILIYGLPR